MVWFDKMLAFHFTIVAEECMADVGYHNSCVKETENISHLGCTWRPEHVMQESLRLQIQEKLGPM